MANVFSITSIAMSSELNDFNLLEGNHSGSIHNCTQNIHAFFLNDRIRKWEFTVFRRCVDKTLEVC